MIHSWLTFWPSPRTATTWNKPVAEPCCAWLPAACAPPFSTSPRAKQEPAALSRIGQAKRQRLRACWAQAGGRLSIFLTARLKILSKIVSKSCAWCGCSASRRYFALLAGAPPRHAIVAALGYQACFLSGLAKIETGSAPHRPFKIVYASLYADVRPSFIVDITSFIEQRHAALMAYHSQYANQAAGSGLFVAEEEIRERTLAEARHYGLLAGVRYGEPFVQKEVGLVDDLSLLPVQSI